MELRWRMNASVFVVFACEVLMCCAGLATPAAIGKENEPSGPPSGHVKCGEAVLAAREKVVIYRDPSTEMRTGNIFFGPATVIGGTGTTWVQIADGWVQAADVVPQRSADAFFSSSPLAGDPFARAAKALCWHLIGKHAQAAEEAQAAATAAPKSAYAAFALGVIREAQGDHARAVRSFSDTIELEPCLVDAYRRRAYIYAADQDARARNGFQDAISRAPDSLETNAIQAVMRVARDLRFERGEAEKAVEELERLSEIAPDDGILRACEIALLWRCAVRREQGDWRRAFSDVNKAVDLRQSPEAILRRGLYRQERNDIQGAAKDFAMAVSLAPGNAEAQKLLGLALYLSGDNSGASASLTKAISLGCDESDVFLFRGLATCDDAPHAAIADFDKAIELSPDNALAYYGRGEAYETLRRDERAIADYTSAIKRDPSYVDALLGRSRSLFATLRFTEASADCDKVLDLEAGNREARLRRADARCHMGKYADSIEDMDHLIRKYPSDAELYRDRARVWRLSNDYEKALYDLTGSLRLAPTAEAYRERASIFSLLGRSVRASVDIENARRLEKPKLTEAKDRQ